MPTKKTPVKKAEQKELLNVRVVKHVFETLFPKQPENITTDIRIKIDVERNLEMIDLNLKEAKELWSKLGLVFLETG